MTIGTRVTIAFLTVFAAGALVGSLAMYALTPSQEPLASLVKELTVNQNLSITFARRNGKPLGTVFVFDALRVQGEFAHDDPLEALRNANYAFQAVREGK